MTTILVIDDEPHIVRLVSFSLQKRGYEVLEANSGPAGIELALAHEPDLILMDVMMPMMTGLEAVQRLKAQPTTADIPVVMLSARSQHAEQQEGLESGAERYICKPFTPRALVDVVSEMVGPAS